MKLNKGVVQSAIVVLFVCLFAPSIFAATPAVSAGPDTSAVSNEDVLFQEIPTVVTSTMKEQKISEAPSAINVVTAEEIKARGYRTLKDMANDIAGWEDVSDANEIIVAVRGMFASTTNTILIMVNGHRMNDLNLGRYNMDQFLGMDTVERVEFIKGPGSVLYGTGALVGVINIITKKGNEVNGVYADEKTTFYGGSKIDYEGGATYGKKTGDWDVLFNFTYLDAQGDEIHQPSSLEVVPAGRSQQDGVIYYNKYPDNWSFFGSIENDADNLRLDVRSEHYARAVPRVPNMSFYDYNQEQVKPLFEEYINYADLKYTIDINETSKLTFNPGVTVYDLKELSFISSFASNFLPPDGTRSGQDSLYEDWQFKAVYENQLRDNLNLMLGFDTLYANFHDMMGDGGSTGAPFTEIQGELGHWWPAGGFGQLIWSPVKKLQLTFSGRYDTFQSFADPSIVKRFGASYAITDDWTTKLLYGESFLSPEWAHVKRLTPGAFISDPSLKPETFNGYDAILNYDHGKTDVNLSLFDNHVENLISSNAIYSYTNMGEETYYGFELEGKYSFTKEFSMDGSYSFVKDEGNTSPDFLVLKDIKNIPQSIYRLGYTYKLSKDFDVRMWGRYYSSVMTSDPVTGQNKIPDWVTVDMSVNYKWSGWDLQFAVTNLLDENYELGGTTNRPLARPDTGISLSVGRKF